jgi:hypothetical protein
MYKYTRFAEKKNERRSVIVLAVGWVENPDVILM